MMTIDRIGCRRVLWSYLAILWSYLAIGGVRRLIRENIWIKRGSWWIFGIDIHIIKTICFFLFIRGLSRIIR